jgi:hypothetical protein
LNESLQAMTIGRSPEPWWVDALPYVWVAGAGLIACGLLLAIATRRRRLAAALCAIGLVVMVAISLGSQSLVTNCNLNPRACE